MKSNFLTTGGRLLFLVVIVTSLGMPLVQANAQGLAPACGYDGARGTIADGKYESRIEGCKLCDFFVLGNNILKFLFLTLVPIGAVIMFVVGGFMFLVSAGNPASLQRGKDILTTTLKGLVIVYAAWLIVDFFFVALGVTIWSGPSQGWFTINCPVL